MPQMRDGDSPYPQRDGWARTALSAVRGYNGSDKRTNNTGGTGKLAPFESPRWDFHGLVIGVVFKFAFKIMLLLAPDRRLLEDCIRLRLMYTAPANNEANCRRL